MQVGDILIVEVDIDKAADLAVFEQSLGEGGKLTTKVVECRLDVVAGRFHDGLALRMLPHGSGDVDANRHGNSSSFYDVRASAARTRGASKGALAGASDWCAAVSRTVS